MLNGPASRSKPSEGFRWAVSEVEVDEEEGADVGDVNAFAIQKDRGSWGLCIPIISNFVVYVSV
jgi:hypothetical protein